MPRELLAGLVLGIDHVAVCLTDMEGRAAPWTELLGLPLAHREDVAAQQTTAAFVDFPGTPTTLELITPMAGNEGLARFLDKRGQGLHHLAIRVSDIDEALRRLDAAGVPLIDRQARAGARGHTVAFLHPKATGGTLVELVQHGTHDKE